MALASESALQRIQVSSPTSRLDFFCEEARLAIELDGFGHGHPDQRRHDAEREAFLASRDIKVLRFWNSSLRRNAQSIRDTILCELQERAPHPLPDYTRPMKPLEGKDSLTSTRKKVC